MAKVKVLVGVVASGYDCKAGNEYELTQEDAITLIRMGKAVPIEAAAKPINSRESDAPKTTKRGK